MAAEMSRQKPQAVGIFYICVRGGKGAGGRGNCLPYAAAFWPVQMLPLAEAALCGRHGQEIKQNNSISIQRRRRQEPTKKYS